MPSASVFACTGLDEQTGSGEAGLVRGIPRTLDGAALDDEAARRLLSCGGHLEPRFAREVAELTQAAIFAPRAAPSSANHAPGSPARHPATLRPE